MLCYYQKLKINVHFLLDQGNSKRSSGAWILGFESKLRIFLPLKNFNSVFNAISLLLRRETPLKV
jgi:hypothetical protein